MFFCVGVCVVHVCGVCVLLCGGLAFDARSSHWTRSSLIELGRLDSKPQIPTSPALGSQIHLGVLEVKLRSSCPFTETLPMESSPQPWEHFFFLLFGAGHGSTPFNPSTQETEVGGSLNPRPACFWVSQDYIMTPCLGNEYLINK